MKRVYIQVGKGQTIDNFTDWEIPLDLDKFLEENATEQLGEDYTNVVLREGEIVNINGVEFIHVRSRKYFNRNEYGHLAPVCELTLLQELLYRVKNDEEDA